MKYGNEKIVNSTIDELREMLSERRAELAFKQGDYADFQREHDKALNEMDFYSDQLAVTYSEFMDCFNEIQLITNAIDLLDEKGDMND